MLANVMTFTLEYALWLEREWPLPILRPIVPQVIGANHGAKNKEAEGWHIDVLFSDHSVLQGANHVRIERLRTHWLIKRKVIVPWNAMIANDSSQNLLHVTVS